MTVMTYIYDENMYCKTKFYYVLLLTELYAEIRPPIIWTGKNKYERVEIWVDR